MAITNFRNIAQAQLEFAEVNYIYGGNGAGKTSILESLFLLSSLRSFRQSKTLDEVISYRCPFLLLQLELTERTLAVEKSLRQPLKLRINGMGVRSREFITQTIPTKILSPHVDFFFNIEADYRRRFFDWLVFHVKPTFQECWSKYEVVLENRNAGLRNHQLTDDKFWIDQLALWGERLTTLRVDVFGQWREKVLHLLAETSLRGKVELAFYQGWGKSDLLSVLRDSVQRDLERGSTEFGPHRGDVELTHQGLRVSSVFSRGQLKLLNLAMVFAQMAQLESTKTILLIDDLGAELDGESLYFFKQWLQAYQGRLFISVIERKTIGDLMASTPIAGREVKIFRVQAGEITED